MANQAIKVAVLEGDFASLCALGGGFLSASSGLPLIVKSASPANVVPHLPIVMQRKVA